MKVTLCYFSATDTTRKTVRAIANGLTDTAAAEIDFTMPAARENAPATFSADDFVVFGVPVYVGRIPYFCKDYLGNVKGTGTPCAIAAVYGNRHFDDALVEMEDLLTANGFKVLGAGAFLGEHSFSANIATGRPDATDLMAANQFGQQLAEKLAAGAAPLAAGTIPGGHPYRDGAPRGMQVTGPATSTECIDCKLCASSCPMGAIDMDDVSKIDGTKCVRCLCCVRVCPTGAKQFVDEMFLQTVARCEAGFAQPRREAELFI